ncbi:CNNM domain-containing protein [Seonamhaeicola aphaedonensis]|uniref:CBS domain containing-hemolysin-like protein n=1 Tax=Seonamhaeicola aphaedonensis TaxID=1461338 RepID=A0A3D9HIT6_9FLAO|nr:CNNM domain-containing protein [Seonamhaeicola aphaedonensis]RED48876.1 CBS domain containing-hemolysin-like protein [Seonamhaeicola aphaedonensis]
MSALIFWATISIFFSFLCSILEAVLLSVTPTFINVKKQEGKDYASTLEILKKDVDKPLIAILTLNTIAHTLGAMMVGVEAESLDYKIELFGINTVGIVSAIMTFLILVASEIIPKTIGATYWKGLANFASKALIIMIFPLKWTGILWFLQLTTKLIGGKGHGSILSREGFMAMTDMAHEEGVFQKNESIIIKNLLTFKEVSAKDVMTPRTIMQIENGTTTVENFFKRNLNLRFSRIPIYSGNTDNITGLVLKDEIFKEMALDNGSKTLSDLKRHIIVVHRNLPIPTLFEKLVESKNHMALVVDEYGSVSGLVTMEDVIETLLGLEIMDESDNVSDLQVQARKNWEARAKKLGLLKDED